MDVPRDAKDLILTVYVAGDDGAPVTGLAPGTAGFAVAGLKLGDTAFQSLTLVVGTLGSYVASSWNEIGSGYYQFCPPNSWIVAGRSTAVRLTNGSNRPINGTINAIGTKDTADAVTVGSISTTLQQQLQDNLATLAFNRKRATDWTFDINIGDISGLSWVSMLFTLKASPTEDADVDALLQVKLTNGGDPGDGLQVLNGAAAGTASDGEIEVVDNERAVVTILAEATAVIDPTDSKFWSYTGPITQSMLAWRRTQAATKPVPPAYQFDVKILNGGGSAETVPASGTLIVPDIVTRTVV